MIFRKQAARTRMALSVSVTRTKPSGGLDGFLKAAGAILATLYVVGVLVTNAHLQRVGISDFSLVQAQGVLVGLQVFAHLLGLVVLVLPVVLALWITGLYLHKARFSEAPSPLGYFIILFGICVVLLFVVTITVGMTIDSMQPWDQPIQFSDADRELSLKEGIKKRIDYVVQAAQLVANRYKHLWTVPLFLCVGYAGFVLMLYTVDPSIAPHGAVRDLQERFRRMSHFEKSAIAASSVLPVIFLACGIIAVATVYLNGYARDVHPNTNRNAGGGQPDVVQLQFQPQAPLITGIAMRTTRLTEDVIAWQQTAQFLYVTPLAQSFSGQAPLIAIDIKAIAAIRQQPFAVELKNGNEVVNAHPLGADRAASSLQR